jgi:hypothetical protein
MRRLVIGCNVVGAWHGTVGRSRSCSWEDGPLNEVRVGLGLGWGKWDRTCIRIACCRMPGRLRPSSACHKPHVCSLAGTCGRSRVQSRVRAPVRAVCEPCASRVRAVCEAACEAVCEPCASPRASRVQAPVRAPLRAVCEPPCEPCAKPCASPCARLCTEVESATARRRKVSWAAS